MRTALPSPAARVNPAVTSSPGTKYGEMIVTSVKTVIGPEGNLLDPKRESSKDDEVEVEVIAEEKPKAKKAAKPKAEKAPAVEAAAEEAPVVETAEEATENE